MSAANAFANAHNSTVLNGNHEEDLLHGSRPSKRQRTGEAPSVPMWAPSAQEGTSLEVDTMILDYMAFQAIRLCLNSRKPDGTGSKASSSSLGRHLQLADSFTAIFKARHPEHQSDAELRLRMLLLKMATLFTQRFTLNPTTPERSELQSLREANQDRAARWVRSSHKRASPADQSWPGFNHLPVPLSQLEHNRGHALHQLGVPAEDEDYEDAFYGTASYVSLLDLLPLFVEVSAASSHIHGSNLTERWMQMAFEFMLQACLEQYLVCGAKGSDVLDEAFAWGYTEEEHDAETAAAGSKSRQTYINDMFEDDEYATEVEGWDTLRNEYLQELTDCASPGSSSVDNNGSDTAARLGSLASEHPTDAFEATVLKFLEALSISIPEPVLIQLERGNLDGMTKEDTKEFLVQCGVGPSLL